MNGSRQNKLLELWNKRKKAIIVNGHGVLSDPNHLKTVPPGVAVMFLAEPGTCMNIGTGLGVHNKFFTSREKFRNFLQGGRAGGVQYKHVTNIHSRTHLPGNKYPDMQIQLEPNKEFPTMGYIKKVPSRSSAAVPLFSETVGPLKPKLYTLSKLLATRKGIVVVSACRDNPNASNERKVMNLPTNNMFRYDPKKRMPRGTRYGKIIRDTPFFKPRKGVTWLHMMRPKAIRTTTKKPSPRKKQFEKLRRAVYSSKVQKKVPFRTLLTKLRLPANMTIVQKKEFETLRKHWSKPPNSIKRLRSGKVLF